MDFCPTCGHWHPDPIVFHPRLGYYGPYGPYYSRIATAGMRSDGDIKQDIKDTLFWDTWVDSDQVNVEVASGVVVLTGTVDSPDEKRAAEEDAWDVPGVVDVENRLQVKR